MSQLSAETKKQFFIGVGDWQYKDPVLVQRIKDHVRESMEARLDYETFRAGLDRIIEEASAR